MKWMPVPKRLYDAPIPFPWAVIVVVFVFFIAVELLSKYFDLPTGKTGNAQYYFNDLGNPLLIAFSISGVIGGLYCMAMQCYTLSCFLEENAKRKFRQWAISRLVILKHTSISPVPNLYSKMLESVAEGSLPPETPMILDVSSSFNGGSRTEKCLELLLSPLKDQLEKCQHGFEVFVYIREDRNDAFNHVVTAMRKMFPGTDMDSKIHLLDDCPDFSVINDWIDKPVKFSRLLITLELHSGNKQDFMENGSAFIFENDSRHMTESEKPLYALRPISSTAGKLADDFGLYVNSGQLELKTIRDIFISGFEGGVKSSLKQAIDRIKIKEQDYERKQVEVNLIPGYRRYAFDKITESKSELYSWLTLVCAAESKTGSNKLIARAKGNEINVILLSGKNPGYWHDIEPFNRYFYAYPACVSLILPLICGIWALINNIWYDSSIAFLACIISAVGLFWLTMTVYEYVTSETQYKMGSFLPLR